MKPLDLQVNINTVIETSRQQNEILNKNTSLNQQIDEKAINEAQTQKTIINKSEKSNHFESVNKYPPKKKENFSQKSKQKKEKKNSKKSRENTHSIDYFA